MTMRAVISQATERTRRALRELDAAAAMLETDGAPPVGRWIDEARRVTEGTLRVLEAHCATSRRRSLACRRR
jgi:hypothetical protein